MFSDAAIGWIIIAALCAIVYFGVTRLVQFVVNAITKATMARREERERIQEALDDELRDQLAHALEIEGAEGGRASRRD